MKKIIPKCKDGSKAFIGANGRWQPCCQVNATNLDYKKSILNHDSFLIKNSKDLKFHESDLFLLWLDKIEDDFDSGLYGCKFVCSSYTKDIDNEYNNVVYLEQFNFITNEDELEKFIEKNNLNNE